MGESGVISILASCLGFGQVRTCGLLCSCGHPRAEQMIEAQPQKPIRVPHPTGSGSKDLAGRPVHSRIIYVHRSGQKASIVGNL